MFKKRFSPVIPLILSITILLSFIPKEKYRKIKHPAEAPFGHVQSIRQVSYTSITDSSGSIYKGEIINDTNDGYRGPAGENSIETWKYDRYGDETEHDICHANGIPYLRIIHTYKYDSRENLLSTNQWYSYAPGYSIPFYANTTPPSFKRDLNIYDSTGKLLQEYSFIEDTVNPSSLKLYRYNEAGKLSETDDSRIDGNDGNLVPTERAMFSYDLKGRVTDKAIYQFRKGLTKDEKTTFDSLGKIVEIAVYGQHKTITRTIVKRTFKETHTLQEDTYDGNGMLLDYSISHFDSAKHLLDKGTFHINYKRMMGNDDLNAKTEPDDTILVNHIVNDDHFNTVVNDIYSNYGTPVSQKTFLNTYDGTGNWIEKITLESDKAVKIEEREIVYFKD